MYSDPVDLWVFLLAVRDMSGQVTRKPHRTARAVDVEKYAQLGADLGNTVRCREAEEARSIWRESFQTSNQDNQLVTMPSARV